MNTIKFEPAWMPKTETHDVEKYTIKQMELAGKTYDVYSNVGLTVYVTNRCNSDCDFCMNKYEENFLCSKEIMDDEEYLNRLEYILQVLKPINPSIMITGGEPTKSKRLPEVIKLIHKYGYKLRSFSTNGTGLLDVTDGKSNLQYMYENNFLNNINISRHAISNADNFKIMKTKGDLTDNQIREIASFCASHNMRVRMGCTLQQSSVSNLSQMLEYYQHYQMLGIDTVVFREPIPINPSRAGFEKYQKETVDIASIFEDINLRSDFVYAYTLDGLYYNVKHFRYQDKLVKCYREKHTASSDIVRDLIFYADGRLVDTNWDDTAKTLINYERRV